MFKYHPDEQFYKDHKYLGTYDEFMEKHSHLDLSVIQKGVYFEYKNGQLDLINEHGHHLSCKDDIAPYQLIYEGVNA